MSKVNVRTSVQTNINGTLKKIPNIFIKYGDCCTIDSLKKQLEISLKLTPTDPDLKITKLELCCKAGPFEEIMSDKQLNDLQDDISKSEKVLLKVHANPIGSAANDENAVNTNAKMLSASGVSSWNTPLPQVGKANPTILSQPLQQHPLRVAPVHPTAGPTNPSNVRRASPSRMSISSGAQPVNKQLNRVPLRNPSPSPSLRNPSPSANYRQPSPAQGIRQPSPAQGIRQPSPAQGVRQPSPSPSSRQQPSNKGNEQLVRRNSLAPPGPTHTVPAAAVASKPVDRSSPPRAKPTNAAVAAASLGVSNKCSPSHVPFASHGSIQEVHQTADVHQAKDQKGPASDSTQADQLTTATVAGQDQDDSDDNSDEDEFDLFREVASPGKDTEVKDTHDTDKHVVDTEAAIDATFQEVAAEPAQVSMVETTDVTPPTTTHEPVVHSDDTSSDDNECAYVSTATIVVNDDGSTAEEVKPNSPPNTPRVTKAAPTKTPIKAYMTPTASKQFSSHNTGATGGEVNHSFQNNIRGYTSTPNNGAAMSDNAAHVAYSQLCGRRASTTIANTPNEKDVRSKSRGKVRRQSSVTPAADSIADIPSPVFNMSKKKGAANPEGRPSIGTIIAQYDILKKNSGYTEDELEWLVVSDREGAYSFAHKKSIASEDNYFKALFEQEMLEVLREWGMLNANNTVSAPSGVIGKYLGTMANASEVFAVNPLDEVAAQTVENAKNDILKFISTEDWKKAEQSNLIKDKFLKALYALVQSTENSAKVLSRKAKVPLQYYCDETARLSTAAKTSANAADVSLASMELWSKRESSTKEYAGIMKAQEVEWTAAEAQPNREALELMRSYIPVNVAAMSIDEIMLSAQTRGGLFSKELATEIKTNKLLHFLVKHTDDIATANFLTGEHKAFFENLEGLDVIELRALVSVLPDSFANDVDKKKMEWRSRVFERCKQLVSQFNGEEVKGMWNPTLKTRSKVQLPPLKQDQCRRLVYSYRLHSQYVAKLKQYDEKSTLLTKKESMLTAAEGVASDALSEWNTVLKESRDPDMQHMFTPDQFAEAKKFAQAEKQAADKKLKLLKGDVDRLRKSIQNSPVQRDEFQSSHETLSEFLLQGPALIWEELNEPVLIEGVFEACPEILKAEKCSAAKFLSPEEESAIRQQELAALLASTKNMAPDDNASEGVTNNNTMVNKLDMSFGAAGSSSVCAADCTTPSRTPGKRNSILQRVNPAVLDCLNNMCTPQKEGKMPITPHTTQRSCSVPRRVSITPNACLAMTKDDNSVQVNKESKSRLLKKYQTPSTEAPASGLAGLLGNPMMSMLGGGKSNAPSFLDMIKLRGQKQATPDDESQTWSTVQEKVLPPTPAPAPVSFLAAIQARRVD